MSTSRPLPFLPVLGAMVGFLVGEPIAHASPQLESGAPSILLERTWDIVELGVSCVDQLEAASSWVALQVGGDAASCNSVRGFGVAFLALAAVVVIALGRMRLSAEHKRLDLARRLIERGLEPPAGLLSAPARADLQRGLVLGFAGLGLVVAGWLLGDRGLSAGGLVPAFIGAGYLASFRLARESSSRPSGPDAGKS
jgi:uncharacterized protein DUF6249